MLYYRGDWFNGCAFSLNEIRSDRQGLMVKFILITFLFVTYLSETSYANIDQVNTPDLYLMGGIVGAKSYHFKLGMACVSGVDASHSNLSDCKQVRFVTFTDKRNAFFIGEPYSILSEAEAKRLIRKLVQLTPEEKSAKFGRGALIFCGLFGGSFLLGGGGNGPWSFYPGAVLLGGFFVHAIIEKIFTKKTDAQVSDEFFSDVDTVFTNPSQILGAALEKKLVKVTLGTEGWSEIQNPVRLRQKYFKRLVDHVDPEAIYYLKVEMLNGRRN